ncbi:MAG: response regulator transcription factor [Dehalococcoidia bacterium]
MQEKQRILVVDDSEGIRLLLTEILASDGYETAAASNGAEGLRCLYSFRPDMVITDIAMPDMDGWDLLQRVREMTEVPVIMLSGLGEEDDKVRGLRTGADDYIVKPILPGEFLARVNAVFRRTKSNEAGAGSVYEDGAIYVDFVKHEVRLRGKRLDLSPQEFRLLNAFIKNPGAVLSPEQLLNQCWGFSEGGPENVRVYMGYLRKKLERDPSAPEMLETVRGFGYRYSPAV